MQDLKEAASHFAFGENWSAYAKHIDEEHITEAKHGLLRIFERNELVGKRFLDIGCGSGLHSLAALRLGVIEVLATDIDDVSVKTTQEVLDTHAFGQRHVVKNKSVFELSAKEVGLFDIVYSWGVLHHTGDLHKAIDKAAELVRPEGLLAIALYRRTLLCGVWRHFKRWYAHTSEKKQKSAQMIYILLLKLRYRLTGKNFKEMQNNYVSSRGMSFEHDVHDWLGGYPYESISPRDVFKLMAQLNFSHIRSNIHPGGIGLFGSGCDEYVFMKKAV